MVTFQPPLGSFEGVDKNQQVTFNAVDVSPGWLPQLWSNFEGDWKLYGFSKAVCDAWTLSVRCPNVGLYEWTFRLKRGDEVKWLGHEGSNGRLIVRETTRPYAKVHRFECTGDLDHFVLPVEEDDVDKGMALERTAWVWNTPRLLYKPVLASVSDQFECSFILFKAGSTYRVFYALASDSAVASLIRSEGKLSVRTKREREEPTAALVVEVVNPNLEAATKSAVEIAQQVLAERTHASIPERVDKAPTGLTWCTWNALGPSYKLSQVLDALDRLKSSANGSFARAIDTVVLDDGWQDTAEYDDPDFTAEKRRGLKSFGTLPGWFDVDEAIEPVNQLEHAVKMIKGKGVKHVGVWVTLQGCWDGFHPDFSDSAFKPSLLPQPMHSSTYREFANRTWYLPTVDEIPTAIDSYYAYIAGSGVDLIKVDDQAHQDFLDEPTLHRALLEAAHSSAAKHFSSVVHCMPGSPRIYGGRLCLLPEQQDAIRNSDDYFPNEPDAHAPHLWLNAHSAVFTRHLLQEPDFDMCQGGHPWGCAHIALRAHQAAPIWTTDSPASAKAASDAWQPLLATSRAGEVVTLQTRRTGSVLPSRIWHGMDEPLIVACQHADSYTVSIIGLKGQKHVILRKSELLDLPKDQDCVIFEGDSATYAGSDGDVVWTGHVEERDAFTLHVAPIQSTDSGHRFALLGLANKIMAFAAIGQVTQQAEPLKDLPHVDAADPFSQAQEEEPEAPEAVEKEDAPYVPSMPGRRLAGLLSLMPQHSFSAQLLRTHTTALLHDLKTTPVVVAFMKEARSLFVLSLAFVWFGWMRLMKRVGFRANRNMITRRRTTPIPSPVLEQQQPRSLSSSTSTSTLVNGEADDYYLTSASGLGLDTSSQGEADIAFGARYEGTYRLWTDATVRSVSVRVDGRDLDKGAIRQVQDDEHGKVYEVDVVGLDNNETTLDDRSVWDVLIGLE